MLPDGYLTGVLYRGILQNTLVPFARHYFDDNYRCQDDNATPHRARVVLDFLQQGIVTKMEQPPRSPHCNPIEHLWDELGWAISSVDDPPQNLDELRQALLDKWAQIPVQRLQRLVASMPILTWHTQNETTRQRHEKNHLCSTKFTTIIFQWHLGMPIRPITHFIIKCRQNWQNTTDKKIGHQIHGKHYITPNNLSLDLADWWNRNNHKKDTSSRGVTTFFAKSVCL